MNRQCASWDKIWECFRTRKGKAACRPGKDLSTETICRGLFSRFYQLHDFAGSIHLIGKLRGDAAQQREELVQALIARTATPHAPHTGIHDGAYAAEGGPEEPGRDYVFSSPRPLWAFGHGLSYTTFSYTNLEASVEADSVKASVLVRNTGKRSGKAVPQLYVRDLTSSVVTPVRQLKAFAKIELQPLEAAQRPYGKQRLKAPSRSSGDACAVRS